MCERSVFLILLLFYFPFEHPIVFSCCFESCEMNVIYHIQLIVYCLWIFILKKMWFFFGFNRISSNKAAHINHFWIIYYIRTLNFDFTTYIALTWTYIHLNTNLWAIKYLLYYVFLFRLVNFFSFLPNIHLFIIIGISIKHMEINLLYEYLNSIEF